MNLKKLIKSLTPPLISSMVSGKKKDTSGSVFSGNYESYEEAAAKSLGYDDESIVEKVKQALLKVKNGTAVYERDSVLFDKIHYSWPLLAILQNIALQNGLSLSLIDFGGSLGSSYYQNIHFLKYLKHIEWKVVEQPIFIEKGRQHFEDDQLKFYPSINDAIGSGSPSTMLLSGVLQYLPKPYDLIEQILQLELKHLVLDRTAFVRGNSDRITVQEVSESIVPSSYPCTFFNQTKFLQMIQSKYNLVADFDSYAEPGMRLEDGSKVYWKGLYFKKR